MIIHSLYHGRIKLEFPLVLVLQQLLMTLLCNFITQLELRLVRLLRSIYLVSGFTITLVGEDDPNTDYNDWPDFGIDTWDFRGKITALIGPDSWNNRDIFPLNEKEWKLTLIMMK